MEWYQYILIVGAGVAAGFINTLAGSGSLLTLPLLMFIGLPPNVANGTNRISVLLQSLVSSASFKKLGQLNMTTGVKLGIPAVAGSVAGAILALKMTNGTMEKAIGVLLIFMFFLVLFKPEVWLKGKSEHKALPAWINHILFFIIGFYGGFIQAGVGFFLLGGLVLGKGLDLVKANAIKNLLVFLFTPFALIVFILGHQVNFQAGLILSVGSTFGAWIAARTAVSWGPSFVRYVLLVAIFGSAVYLILG